MTKIIKKKNTNVRGQYYIICIFGYISVHRNLTNPNLVIEYHIKMSNQADTIVLAMNGIALLLSNLSFHRTTS